LVVKTPLASARDFDRDKLETCPSRISNAETPIDPERIDQDDPAHCAPSEKACGENKMVRVPKQIGERS